MWHNFDKLFKIIRNHARCIKPQGQFFVDVEGGGVENVEKGFQWMK